ncbi:MAG: exopolysaccharide biosynthesis protein [Planctomycetes bacterium]|nr:exopolysaccharide biosynthesis protein [Planctomycetota bacterium]
MSSTTAPNDRNPAPAAPPPVRTSLRLSAILIDLGAEAHAEPPAEDGAAAATAALGAVGEGKRSTKEERRRARKLRRHLRRVRSNLTLGEIMERTAHAGFGFLAAFLGLVSLPFIGLSTPFGLAIAFIGAQMAWGRERPWLPKRLLRRKVALKTIRWLSDRVARRTRGFERWVRPRWSVLLATPSWNLVGVALILLGAGLALPLPIPGSNWIFLVPLLFFSFGLLEDDGLLLIFGFFATAVLIVLAILSWHLIVEELRKALSWLGIG